MTFEGVRDVEQSDSVAIDDISILPGPCVRSKCDSSRLNNISDINNESELNQT